MHPSPPKSTRGRSFWREAGHRGLGNRMGVMALGTQKATGISEPMDDSVFPVESALLTYVWNQSWTWGPCSRATPLCSLLCAGMGQLRPPCGLSCLALGSKNTTDVHRMACCRNVECATAHCFPSVLPLLSHFGDQVTNRGFSWAGMWPSGRGLG